MTEVAASHILTWRRLLFSFKGRASRFDYWVRVLIPATLLNAAASVGDHLISGSSTDTGPISILSILATTWGLIAVGAKRCHDRDRSGWFLLLFLVPIISLWPAIELGFLRGTSGANRFGTDPAAPNPHIQVDPNPPVVELSPQGAVPQREWAPENEQKLAAVQRTDDEVDPIRDRRPMQRDAEEFRVALPLGTRLEEYVLEEVLGSPGGFGITYRARDQFGRSVAVKEYFPSQWVVRDENRATVHPRSGRDEEIFAWGMARFRDEAQILAQFEHPNIVKVQRYFQANNTVYMVMDYVDGENLRARLERGQIGEQELRKLLDGLLDGLQAAHGSNVLHRDVKPSNIYVRAVDGVPVLLDFGAARQALGERSQSLTEVLTPPYAPFEQYGRGLKQGPWTDIYALGVVLYEAMSGTEPPDGPTRYGGEEGPALSSLVGGRYSTEFVRLVDAALQPRAQDRPQSIAQCRAILGNNTNDAKIKDSVPTGKLRWLTIGHAASAVSIMIILSIPIVGLLKSFNGLQEVKPPADSATILPQPIDPATVEAGLNLSPEARTEVQFILEALGFDVGSADGIFGSRTRAAIRDFQGQRGYTRTGYLTSEQVKSLTAALEEAWAGDSNCSYPPSDEMQADLVAAVRNTTLSFEFKDVHLGNEAKKTVERIARWMQKNPRTSLGVSVAANSGEVNDAFFLGKARVAAVRHEFAALGIDRCRLFGIVYRSDDNRPSVPQEYGTTEIYVKE